MRGQPNQYTGRTHCLRGHEYTPDNVFMQGNARVCRTCKRQRQRDRAERLRNAPPTPEPLAIPLKEANRLHVAAIHRYYEQHHRRAA